MRTNAGAICVDPHKTGSALLAIQLAIYTLPGSLKEHGLNVRIGMLKV